MCTIFGRTEPRHCFPFLLFDSLVSCLPGLPLDTFGVPRNYFFVPVTVQINPAGAMKSIATATPRLLPAKRRKLEFLDSRISHAAGQDIARVGRVNYESSLFLETDPVRHTRETIGQQSIANTVTLPHGNTTDRISVA